MAIFNSRINLYFVSNQSINKVMKYCDHVMKQTTSQREREIPSQPTASTCTHQKHQKKESLHVNVWDDGVFVKWHAERCKDMQYYTWTHINTQSGDSSVNAVLPACLFVEVAEWLAIWAVRQAGTAAGVSMNFLRFGLKSSRCALT